MGTAARTGAGIRRQNNSGLNYRPPMTSNSNTYPTRLEV